MLEVFKTLLAIFMLCVLGGASIGVGFAIGLALVMRISGDGRTVLLTFARTKSAPPTDTQEAE